MSSALTVADKLRQRFNSLTAPATGSNCSIDDELINLIIGDSEIEILINTDSDACIQPRLIFKKLIIKLCILESSDIEQILTKYSSGKFWNSIDLKSKLVFIEQILASKDKEENKALETKPSITVPDTIGNTKDGKLKQIKIPFGIVADEILKRFHLFNMRDTKQIYIYKNGVYKSAGAEAILETSIRDVHDELYKSHWRIINPEFEIGNIPKATTNYVNEVIAYIRSYTHRPRIEIDDAASRYINLKNGLFDLSSWKFEEHDPKYISISQCPVNYDENATCPNISQFLTEVARPADIDFLLEWVGYCLTLEVKHQKAVLVYGPPGTGKSVYLSLLEAIVGDESRTCQPLQKIESDKYRCAQLYGKKVNICGDIPDMRMHESITFKQLTSGIDTMSGENKFQNSFDFRNTAKLIFSANKIPEGPKDEAYYQRWILIEFVNRFRGITREVKGIIDSLTTECELSGLLVLALKGLKKLTDTGTFSYSKTFAEIEKEYLLNSNPSATFMDECIVMSTDDIDGTVLYCTFVEWCRTHNTELISQIGFTRKISSMGYTFHRENVSGSYCTKKVTVWDNIQLRKYPVGQDRTGIGQDRNNSSCPN